MRKFLACSGGGDRGIVLLGMINQLAKQKGIESVKYEMMAGISTGSLVTCLMSMIDHNNFFKELNDRVHIFCDPKFKVVDEWIYGQVFNIIDAFVFHESLYSSKPLKKLIGQHFDLKTMKTPFVVGAYNKTLSTYETLHPTHETVLASCSLPIILPHVTIEKICPETKQLIKHVYEDGAVKHMIPVQEIKSYINEKPKQPVHIDILVCFPINDTDMFFKMLVPPNGNAMMRSARRSLADVMLNVLQNDLASIASIVDVSTHTLMEKPCNVFKKDNITVQIFSPDYGWHSNFTNMNKENSMRLFHSGEKTVKHFYSKV
jgi:predicted acylesterase/phospholipase RssA